VLHIPAISATLNRDRRQRGWIVLTKEQMVKAIQELPEDASVDEAVDRLYLLEKIERGIAQADAGQTVSHEEALRRLSRWLK
jgi:predicted transcriptional regulator